MTQRREQKILLRPHVFARDVLAEVGDGLPALAEAVDELTEYCPDEPQDERLVRALVEPELPDGPLEEWCALYEQFGLAEFVPLVFRLRVVNCPSYCDVHGIFGMSRPFYEATHRDELVQVERPQTIHPAGGVYTLGLCVDLGDEGVAATRASLCDDERPSVQGLVARLVPRIEMLVNGTMLLAQGGEQGCLAALASTLWTFSKQRAARTRHARSTIRESVFDAAVAALDLGPHAKIAKPLLIRNHPRHLNVQVGGLGDGWTVPAWGGSLGLFERHGDLLQVVM